MKTAIKLTDLRKEMKAEKGTYYTCVNILFSYAETCPSLRKILPKSKNKAKTEEHEVNCKEFVRFGQPLTRKTTKTVNGVRCVTEINYVKNYITVDECLRYFLNIYNNNTI